MKKGTLATVITATMFALNLSLVFAAAKINFTGTWVMDKSRSEGLPPDVEQNVGKPSRPILVPHAVYGWLQ